MATPEVDPLVGKVLNGRFEILSQIGAGGMGRVYKAIQRPLDRVVALKVLNPRYDGSMDPGFEKRFFLEASTTAKLKHPNTITVHDYGRTEEGIYFLAMEYVDGQTLAQALKLGPFAWPRALAVGAQIARSLREAHKLGLVHRDLKPANIMLLTEGTSGDVVKVLDFGLVKSFTPESAPETELTQAGVLMGSPLYMAPELARNEADPRTDVYSLGVLLFQCIAGRPPFVGTEAIDLIVRHVREKPPVLKGLRPDLPEDVNALVMRCLEKLPSARFQSMDELLDAMRAASVGQGLSAVFGDPRSGANAMPRHTSSGVVLISTGGSRPVPRVSRQEVITESETTDPRKRRRRRQRVAIALTLLALAGAVAVATYALRPPKVPQAIVLPVAPVEIPTAPEAPPQAPVEPEPPAAPVQITFQVATRPPGATVRAGDAVLGKTPLTFTRERLGEAPVKVELTLTLDGYQAKAVQVVGEDGTVEVDETLARKPSGKRNRPPKKPDAPPGYKADPYQ